MFSAALITIIIIALVYGAEPMAGVALYIMFFVVGCLYVGYLAVLFVVEWIKTGEKPEWREFVDKNLSS